jgi:hypothetical protein
MNYSGNYTYSMPSHFGALHDGLINKGKIQDSVSLPFNSTSMLGYGSAITNYQVPPYWPISTGIPTGPLQFSHPVSSYQPHPPMTYQSESVYTTSPTVYPQFHPHPYSYSCPGPSTFPITDQISHPHVSMDPTYP